MQSRILNSSPAFLVVLVLTALLNGCGGGSSSTPPVTKTTPTITWAAPASITYGTALSATQLDATASVPGSFSYSPASGQVLAAGKQTLSVTFSPTDATDYNSATASVSLTVGQATPVITWATPAALPYGTALGSAQLDATASTPGTFVYTPASGAQLALGSQKLSTAFTPTDATDYTTASASVTLSVIQGTPIITWNPPATEPLGTILSATQLNATASVPGSFTYSPGAGTVLSTAGTTKVTATFTPTDAVDYSTATAVWNLTVTAATPAAYTWSNVQIVAGGYVPALYFHPTQKGLMYARTDIGGAYRWSPTDTQWVPLLDFDSPATWWYGGVEAIGLDPTDANRLYLAVGEYALETYDGNGAILVSDDQGKTFTTSPLPFRNGSNDSGRNSGERIAVDANSPNIVYFGSRLGGLQISTDHGSTWNQSTGLAVTSTANGSGVVSVVPIKSSGSSGSATPVVYAAVAGTGNSGDPVGLYVTTAGGTAAGAWTAVAGQPSFTGAATPLAPLHAVLGPNGSLYVLYADQPGPYGITTSQLWEFTPGASWTSGTWKQITLPPNSKGNTGESGYGAIEPDPSHPGTLLLATIDQYYPGDTIYRSTDDGNTWKDISAVGGTHSATGAPYIASFGTPIGTGNWVGSVVIDPFNSDHVLYGTGSMIWESTDVTSADSGGTVAWGIGAQGVEETSVGFTLAPPSGPTLLLSAVGDIYGFAHQDLTKSPAQGFYTGPSASPSGMDFVQKTPTTVVRVTKGATPYGVVSTDAGLTWTPFAANPAGTQTGGGSIAIAPDGSSMVWSPADTSSVWYSTNAGATWTAATGIPAQAQVVSDRVTAGLYYGLVSGSLYQSTNAGATWVSVQNDLPTNASLTVMPGPTEHLVLAGGGGPLYESIGGAPTLTLFPVPTVASSNYFAFGAPAPGSSIPTEFLYGNVLGNSATTPELFRSTDGGTTWTQINDAAHQWGGGVQSLSGDMRTFGTVYVGTNGRGIIWGTSH